MAQAKKCDRCGALYEKEFIDIPPDINSVCAIGFVRENSHSDKIIVAYRDLCPVCLLSFKSWFTEFHVKKESKCSVQNAKAR